MGWDGWVPLQVDGDLASISLVFITFWLKCSSPVGKGVEASVRKANVLHQKHRTVSPQQHVVP